MGNCCPCFEGPGYGGMDQPDPVSTRSTRLLEFVENRLLIRVISHLLALV